LASAAAMFAALSSRELSCTAATRTTMRSSWVVAMPRLLAVSPARFLEVERLDYGTSRRIRELSPCASHASCRVATCCRSGSNLPLPYNDSKEPAVLHTAPSKGSCPSGQNLQLLAAVVANPDWDVARRLTLVPLRFQPW